MVCIKNFNQDQNSHRGQLKMRLGKMKRMYISRSSMFDVLAVFKVDNWSQFLEITHGIA